MTPKSSPKLPDFISELSNVEKNDLLVFEKALKPEYSQNTKKAIIFDLRHFINWYLVKFPGTFVLSTVTETDVKNYQCYCRDDLQYAPATTKRRILHLKALYIIAVSLGKVKNNPCI